MTPDIDIQARLRSLPGTVAWLRTLRDKGPQRRRPSPAADMARKLGLTDYWVKDTTDDEMMLMDAHVKKHVGNDAAYLLVDYGENLEAINEHGLEALAKFDK